MCPPWPSTPMCHPGRPGNPHSVSAPAWPPWPWPQKPSSAGAGAQVPHVERPQGDGELRERGPCHCGLLLRHPCPGALGHHDCHPRVTSGGPAPTAQVRDSRDAGLRGAPVPLPATEGRHGPRKGGDDPTAGGALRRQRPHPHSHTHLAPGAGPGRLPGLEAFQTQSLGDRFSSGLCRDAQVACRHGEAWDRLSPGMRELCVYWTPFTPCWPPSPQPPCPG